MRGTHVEEEVAPSAARGATEMEMKDGEGCESGCEVRPDEVPVLTRTAERVCRAGAAAGERVDSHQTHRAELALHRVRP